MCIIADVETVTEASTHRLTVPHARGRSVGLYVTDIHPRCWFVPDISPCFARQDVPPSLSLAPGEPGGGGEYEVVTGFGWTNGVALDFITKYYGPGSKVPFLMDP